MGGAKTRRLLRSSPREAPVAFQLFGSEPEVLGEAARRLAGEGAAWLDLNVGCPVKKFIRNCAGSALLRDLPRAAAIVRAIRAGLPGDRLGQDADGLGRELDRRARVRAHRRRRGRGAALRARPHARPAVHGPRPARDHPRGGRGGARHAGARERRRRDTAGRLRDAARHGRGGRDDRTRRDGEPLDLRAGALAGALGRGASPEPPRSGSRPSSATRA